jgi:hypothetical protein
MKILNEWKPAEHLPLVQISAPQPVRVEQSELQGVSGD